MRNFIIALFLLLAATAWSGEPNTYQTNRYTVKEKTEMVKRALKVFRDRAETSPYYHKRYWLYDTLHEDNTSYLSFTTNDQNADLVFSPDEQFAYYLEVTPGGQSRLTGIKIDTKSKFFIQPAGDFYIETCDESQKSYVIVTEDAGTYHVFDLNGKEVTIPDMPADINDLKNVICY